ncbi:TTC31 protein, partial [Spelaeornis formosus]|nr:TTC31 protein [Elachura formosa]
QEELDLSCTFVCKAREKAGIRLLPPGGNPRTQNVEPSRKVPEKGTGDPVDKPAPPRPLQPRPPSPSTIEQSLALAGHGIEAAQLGQHTEAVWAFTVALELNPQEHRLLGNRSYCLEKLGRYQEALEDAEAALALQPGWPKGCFRKGKALQGLQRYAEAMHTFEELLLQDGTYAEARMQLEACRALLQVRLPFPTPQPCPLSCCVPHASPLSPHSSAATPGSCQDTGDKSVTRDSAETPTKGLERKPAVASGHPTLPPSHPARSVCLGSGGVPACRSAGSDDTSMALGRDCFPLWVGNITSHINEKVLRRAFGRFGEIRSMRLLPERHCAFINFCGKTEAEEAFKAMQGATVEDCKLLLQLKHPAHATPKPLPRA